MKVSNDLLLAAVALAIGLWLAVVILFLLPEREHKVHVTVSADGSLSSLRTLWIPSGDDVYRCSNNDHGGGLVEDHGRGSVDDHGRGSVDDHGRGSVDDQGRGPVDDHGGGVVEDGAAHVPAPTRTLLGDSRGYQEFWCDLNDYGGPVVKHRDGRVVAVAMPAKSSDRQYQCGKDLNGDAVILYKGQDNKMYMAQVDHGGGIVDDQGRGPVDDSGMRSPPPPNANGCTGSENCEGVRPDLIGADFVYCMVAFPDSNPVIVNIDGEVLPGNNAPTP